jgi:ubiquinone/menaquinone biosynthesis C-methylase UbiE
MDYKAQIAEVFDYTAPMYGGFGTHYFDVFADRLLSHVKGFPGANVLDVATGRGAILKRVLSAIGREGKAIGIDISPKMIEETKREIREPNVSLYCMDAEQLSFGDHSFDIVYCGFALFFFPEPKKALCEFKRVLKPGGKFAASTWGKVGTTRRVLQEKLVSMGFNPTVASHSICSAEELSALFTEAGFSTIQIVQDHLEHLYANFDHWWDCLWKHAMRRVMAQLNEEQLISLKAQLNQELESANRPNGFHEDFEVFYTIASKP